MVNTMAIQVFKQGTPPIAEILCVKNGRAIVVCGFFIRVANVVADDKDLLTQ